MFPVKRCLLTLFFYPSPAAIPNGCPTPVLASLLVSHLTSNAATSTTVEGRDFDRWEKRSKRIETYGETPPSGDKR